MGATWIELDEMAELVRDGQTLALGGMTVYRRPVGFVRALLRRATPPRDLTLLCFTAGIESDLLVGAGCVGTVHTCYFGLESFGFAPMFTAAAQAGSIRIVEETEASFAAGIRAHLAGERFQASSAWVGTDLPSLRPDVKQITDPYSGEPMMAFPALSCDITVIHALEADGDGNITINNNYGVDLDLIFAGDTVLVTAERRVDHCERAVDRTLMPAPAADYIALAPRGAWPTSCYPLYPIGGGEFMRYVDACNAGEFEQYVAAFVRPE